MIRAVLIIILLAGCAHSDRISDRDGADIAAAIREVQKND